jgi:hypothetical protein
MPEADQKRPLPDAVRQLLKGASADVPTPLAKAIAARRAQEGKQRAALAEPHLKIFDAAVDSALEHIAVHEIAGERKQVRIASKAAQKLASLGKKQEAGRGLMKIFNAVIECVVDDNPDLIGNFSEPLQVEIACGLVDDLVSLERKQEVRKGLLKAFEHIRDRDADCMAAERNTAIYFVLKNRNEPLKRALEKKIAALYEPARPLIS